MIMYHGTPIGGPAQDAARFLFGRHALVPFTYQINLGAVAEFCSSFVFDNGAYTIWKKGGTLDVDEYIKWCDSWSKHPGLDWCLIPDVIDGSEEENDVMLGCWPKDLPGVPVWHLHESLERLTRLSHEWHRVALGSSGAYSHPGSKKWHTRMIDVMNTLCDELGRPRCRIHGLRMAAPKIVERYPFSSVDSTNVAVNSNATRAYCPPSRWQRAVNLAWRLEFNSPPIWNLIDG